MLKTYGISQNQLAIAIVNPMPYIRGVSESKEPSAEAAFAVPPREEREVRAR